MNISNTPSPTHYFWVMVNEIRYAHQNLIESHYSENTVLSFLCFSSTFETNIERLLTSDRISNWNLLPAAKWATFKDSR